MALTFVYGNSGSGKSEFMYQKIADMAEQAPYQHYYVVVPEQFTMGAQKSLVAHSSSGVILNIDVVSFERLAYRVFDELGVRRIVMEETGKSLVLRRIVEENEPNLTILKRSLTKMGYIGELKSVISELMQYGISPEDLEDFLDELPDESSLSYKVQDILQIYRSFDAYLQEGYVTAERVLDLLSDVSGESSLLRNAVFLFDGYTGFTPVQINVIRRLMRIASEIYVSVTLDTREPLFAPARMEDLFYMSRRMVIALSQAARETSFGIADPVRIEAHAQSRFHDSPVLSHLEQNLFRIPGRRFEGPCGDHLRIVSLLSPREELCYAAAGICTIVRERGYRYRDCAILCSDVGIYEKYADSVFELYDIPGFVDRKQSILYHPLIEFIRSVPEIADADYSIESVFRYLRTGLAGFTEEEVDRLENYCIEKGIRGARRWKKEFDGLPARHGRIRSDEERARTELAEINALRQRFVSRTEKVLSAFRKKDVTVRERTEALYGLLSGLNVEEQLRSETERFEKIGDEVAASVNRQIYKIVIDLLDKMVDLLGWESIPTSEYSEILEAGFDSAKVGTIPPGNDCVILGDIERTRLDEVKVLFLLGANDGEIPKKSNRQGILSTHDREVMEEHDLELAPGEREQMFLQRFYLYLALARPSNALCLTFSRMDSEGAAIRPSYLVSTLEKMFPELHTEEAASDDLLPLVTPKSSVESWLTGLIAADEGVFSPQWKALHRWYVQHSDWSERIGSLLNAHFSVYKKKNLDAALARALYGEILFNSFTRLERFGGCPYGHFLEYGLKLAAREEFTFSAMDMGTLSHMVLQKYGTKLEENDSWDDVTEERQDEILREAIGESVRELYDEALFETAAGAYDLERIYRILRRSVWAITEQIRRGDFLPEGYEIDIDREITAEESPACDAAVQNTPDEQEHRPTARILGRVDRMDICEEGDRVSVRVIDYKSSSKTLDLHDVYYGRKLQLPVYLNTAMEYLAEKYPDREIVPAGIFYFQMDNPMLDEAVQDEEESRKKLLQEMKPNGLLNADPSVVRKMDHDLEETGKSDVLPISFTKGGAINQQTKNTLDSESFEDLMRYVRRTMDETSRQMTDGEVGIYPYRVKNRTGCKYCEFSGICGFDLRIPGYAYREEQSVSNEEALKRMRERLGGGAEGESGEE